MNNESRGEGDPAFASRGGLRSAARCVGFLRHILSVVTGTSKAPCKAFFWAMRLGCKTMIFGIACLCIRKGR